MNGLRCDTPAARAAGIRPSQRLGVIGAQNRAAATAIYSLVKIETERSQ